MHGNQRIRVKDLGQGLPVDKHGQVLVAIVNMTSDRFDLVSGDCVGAMSNSVFEADGGIHKLSDESVNTFLATLLRCQKIQSGVKAHPSNQKRRKCSRSDYKHSRVLGQGPQIKVGNILDV
jgi:hypothetical protein